MYLKDNLSYLRVNKKITQNDMAALLAIKISRYGAWEEGRAEPSLTQAMTIAKLHNITIEQLLMENLSKGLPFERRISKYKITKTRPAFPNGYKKKVAI